MKTCEKVGAFVIKEIAGTWRLLLFTHVDHPDAPIQIPGGGLENGEDPLAGTIRELKEEAGVGPLKVLRKLGVSEMPWNNAILRRHCFVFDGSGLPDHWIHQVSGIGEDTGLKFEFSWHRISADFTLSGDLGYFLTPSWIPELFEKSSRV